MTRGITGALDKDSNLVRGQTKRMRLLVTIITLIFPISLFAQKDSVDVWIAKINNASIAGTCHYVWVIEPTIREVDKLIKAGKAAEPQLLDLLADEMKGVTAHYILSNIHGATHYSTRLSADSITFIYNYNGLEFQENARGIIADRTELLRIKREWDRKLSN
jgi:hypothetical protein